MNRTQVFKTSATCGVKWREGLLEVKSLVRDETVPGFIAQVCEKISFAEVGEISRKAAIPVTKKRWLNYYTENLQACGEDEEPSCQLEVSSVQLPGKHYSSICLEASGTKAEERLALLKNTLRQLMEKFPALESLPGNYPQQSYPQLLLDLQLHGEHL